MRSMKGRVLVVDDDAALSEMLGIMLRGEGFDPTFVADGDHAMQAFREWSPDVLVSDIGMPNEDGYSLIRRVRELESSGSREIPAVALTAYATDEDRSQALSAGFQVHVSKPIEPESFVSCLASVLGRNVEN